MVIAFPNIRFPKNEMGATLMIVQYVARRETATSFTAEVEIQGAILGQFCTFRR